MFSLNILGLITLIVIFETAAMACVKKYDLCKKKAFLAAAIGFYALVVLLLSLCFKYKSMGITNVIWSGMSVLLVAIAGVLFFKEKIHVHDILAAALVTSGILIFELTD